MNYFCSAIAPTDDNGARYFNCVVKFSDTEAVTLEQIAEAVAARAEVPVDQFCLMSVSPVPDLL